jgi:N-acetylglucosaminyldiphosphoundecaprenol N-acetyl-beta-D-mannosaminyltransferase
MGAAIRCIENAAQHRRQLVVATPNADFLALADQSATFRENILRTGLSLADGMPLVWFGRLLGIPISERVSGSTLIERFIDDSSGRSHELKLFFLGGEDRVAETACARVNQSGSLVKGVGWLNPGYGSVDEMSTPEIVAKINASAADVLIVSLGAEKGHAWIERNRSSLRIPIIGHLGATVKFLSGTVRRAPRSVQRVGLEWLWRLWEEPHLARRYSADPAYLLRELFTAVVPLATWRVLRKLRFRRPNLITSLSANVLTLSGHLTEETLPKLRDLLQRMGPKDEPLVVNLDGVSDIDCRSLGYLYELVYHRTAGLSVRLVGGARIAWLLTLHRARGLIERR